ncbi:S-layer homology domain-containing protein [Paenibacillus sp. 1_12]|uniref:S-layer homology domain-containing protein n=1 Tax=Paenibacillus sp. 1_12 TaxID=1566278 RepID=UPI0008E80A7F|nr:S-layer homology domain-containing protein [Paenibacillus sp. 1_12]SFK71647.1 S-layer homology domain-containing protein [Paenibacillus sp. 1_12]
MKLLKSLKIITLMTAITTMVPIASIHAAAEINFKDTQGHWAEADIQIAAKKGYVDGYVDETFKPNNSITRAEFVKMLVTGLAFKTDPSNSEYWHSQFLASAQANGLITSGETGTDKDLNRNILREEMAKIAVRGTGTTTDEDTKWMYLATSNGIITGLNESGELGMDKPTTRAEAITVIERILKIRAGTRLPADKYATSEAEIAWHHTNVFSMAPEYFGNGVRTGSKFRWDWTRFANENGYSEVEKYVVIDMDDPRDPNRKLIPENFRWNMKVGNTRTVRSDVPDNTYVFLSFNHFVRYDSSQRNPSFAFANLNLSPVKLKTGDNVDSANKLINIVSYVPYLNSGTEYYYANGIIELAPNTSEVSIITGQISPKNLRIENDSDVAIYKRSAQGLGDKSDPIIFASHYESFGEVE